jgi:hypothetical protein
MRGTAVARSGTMLGAAIAVLLTGAVQAQADAVVSLQDVTFDDGGTATGTFQLNVYGYLDGVAIASTPGSALGASVYTSGSVATTPPASVIGFNTDGSVFDLVMQFTTPLGASSSGSDILVVGSDAGNLLSGSYEACVSSAPACGVPADTFRLITAGSVFVAEPTTLSLLGFGAVLLPLVRRMRPVVRI